MKMEGKRKFVVTMFFGAACFVLCWYSHMTGGEVVTAVSVLSALYKAANIYDKKNGGAG